MKKLPLGIQEFSKLRTQDLLYVDKTEYIFKLIDEGCYYFLSRPRRFGKSLLVNTLMEIFSGNKHYFEGLWIEDKIDWQKYPVILIDFSKSGFADIGLQEALINRMTEISQEYN
ncbi:MAG: AAA family ATPase, partial [Bacteroidetes bacterium]